MQVSPSRISRLKVAAPGRINLLGEHTDYNEGFVLPATIEQQISFTFKKNESPNRCRITSTSLGKVMRADLDLLRPTRGWENYISGVLAELLKRSGKLQGFDVDFKSDIPPGAGLSSSAALECGLAFGLNLLFELGLSPLELIRLSQKAEHHFVGTQCGIMDQFACVMGRKNHFILLDCRDLHHRYIPADLGDCSLLLMGSGVKHTLAESAYNDRREECRRGVAILRKTFPEIHSLRDTTTEHLNALEDSLPGIVSKRCRYVLEENARVLKAVQALENRDMEGLGTLLCESHRGLRDDYQVSCPEVDFLVDTALSYPGVLGARIMGGGFGGCSLNLVRSEALESAQAGIRKAYRDSFGKEAEPLEVRISDGVRVCS